MVVSVYANAYHINNQDCEKMPLGCEDNESSGVSMFWFIKIKHKILWFFFFAALATYISIKNNAV